jgi:hypothetical protein
MADLVTALKPLRLYGMAACHAERLEQGQIPMITAAPLPTQLDEAEATDRATLGCQLIACPARHARPSHPPHAGPFRLNTVRDVPIRPKHTQLFDHHRS